MILLPVWWYNFEQTRVDQITQQLKAGSLEFGDTQDSTIGTDHQDQRSPSPQSDSKVVLLLILGFLKYCLLICSAFHVSS